MAKPLTGDARSLPLQDGDQREWFAAVAKLEKGKGFSKEERRNEQIAHLRATLFSLLLCLVLMGVGYNFGVMNGALLRIVIEYPTTNWGVAALASAHSLGTAFGSMLGGQLVDWAGRKPAMFWTSVMLVVVPTAMAFSMSIAAIVFWRFVIGICIGSAYIVVTAYTAELSPMHLRGALTALHEVALNAGQVIGYVASHNMLGMEHDWRWMLALGAMIPAVTVSCMMIFGAPESPRWLMMQGRDAQADVVLVRYLGVWESQEAWRSMQRAGRGSTEGAASWGYVIAGFSHPKMRWMLIACIVVGLAEPSSGSNGLLAYSSKIFEESMPEEQAFMETILMGLSKLVASIFAMAVVESVGRRPLLIISSLGVLGCNLTLALAYQCAWHSQFQVAVVCIFMAVFELGICPLSFTYCSEVLSTEVRAKGMAMTFCLARTLGFANLVYLPALLDANCSLLFYVQSTLCVMSLATLVAYAPETKGKSLEDMHEIFES